MSEPSEVKQPVAPLAGTPEYEQAMAAKMDASAAKAQEAAQGTEVSTPRPENVPEEFWDGQTGQVKTEELLKALAEAKKPTEDSSKTDPENKTSETPEEIAAKAAESAGLDINTLQAEFDSSGTLSEESYGALEKAGIGKAYVDAFIAGQQALTEQGLIRAYEQVGGKDQFQAMTSWAKEGFTPAEIDAYNAAVAHADEATRNQALLGLKARYEAANGKQPKLLSGGVSSGVTSGYASRAEMVADMRDPKYNSDSAYRARVQQKLAVTHSF